MNAASGAGLQGRAQNAGYSASKHGVIGLTRTAAKDMGEGGIEQMQLHHTYPPISAPFWLYNLRREVDEDCT